MSVNPVAVGIDNIMREKGLKQLYVAHKTNFTLNQFSAMLNGRKIIRAEYLPSIADALGVTVADIYTAAYGQEVNADA